MHICEEPGARRESTYMVTGVQKTRETSTDLGRWHHIYTAIAGTILAQNTRMQRLARLAAPLRMHVLSTRAASSASVFDVRWVR
jgi:hypothetical protein